MGRKESDGGIGGAAGIGRRGGGGIANLRSPVQWWCVKLISFMPDIGVQNLKNKWLKFEPVTTLRYLICSLVCNVLIAP